MFGMKLIYVFFLGGFSVSLLLSLFVRDDTNPAYNFIGLTSSTWRGCP